MHLPFSSCTTAAVLLLGSLVTTQAAGPAGITHYYDEVTFRYLTLESVGATQVQVQMRGAGEPGVNNVWMGQGSWKEKQLVFAALVEEGQDRGTFFVAKGGESKLEVEFRPGQKMPQDPGILGSYRRISDEKRLQLARKEFQAADERLQATLKASSRTWTSEDKPVAADWKGRWPALRERWMKIAYQAPEAAKAQVGPFPPQAKGRPAVEMDVAYWLKMAQATASGYYFMQQMPDGKSQEAWDGSYDDGFGGQVSIRRTADGRLRVSLACSRVNELQGSDLQGVIPVDGVKAKKAGEPASAEGVFVDPEMPDATKEVQVRLKRKGGFLWVEIQRKQEPPGRLAWLDGIYRWAPVPVE